MKKIPLEERRRRAAAKDPRQIPLPLGEEYKAGLIFPTQHRHSSADGLTKQEEKILRMTARLWNAYCKMQPVHPSEMEELQLYVHQIQYLVARRIAKRLEPHVWA